MDKYMIVQKSLNYTMISAVVDKQNAILEYNRVLRSDCETYMVKIITSGRLIEKDE